VRSECAAFWDRGTGHRSLETPPRRPGVVNFCLTTVSTSGPGFRRFPRVYVTVGCPSVCLSVCRIDRQQQRRPAGLLLIALREGDIATGFGSRFSHLDLQCVEAARLMSIPQGCLGIGRNIRISRKACCGLLYPSVVITTREKPSECPLELILRLL